MITFGKVSLFALIVMALSADLISITEPFFYYKFSAMSLATSLLTLLTVIPMFVIDMLRQGAMFSYIIVEIVWLSVLWVLWLSSGSYAAWTDGQLISLDPLESNCDFGNFDTGLFTQGCQEVKSIMALSFLTWIALMVYTGILLFVAIRAQGQGQNVWTRSARDDALFYPAEAKSGGSPAQVPTIPASFPQTYPQTYPPAPAPGPAPGAIQV
jgi:hypothetical protein